MMPARQHIFDTLERQAQQNNKDTWENESDDLARQFEQIALELEGGGGRPEQEEEEEEEETVKQMKSPRQQALGRTPPLKYPPRIPNGRKPRRPAEEDKLQDVDDETEDYVYDTYIRRPAYQHPSLENSRDVVEADRLKIGVIVIEPEDEQYWDLFAEDDDDEKWDSEDADSNGMAFFILLLSETF